MKPGEYYKNTYYTTNELKPGRSTLVFVHGLSGSSSAWEKYLNKFQDEYNVLAYDIRGHGRSVKLGNLKDYEIEKFAQDLDELINYLKLHDIILISHSFGAMIALEFLGRQPSAVKASIFLSPNFNTKKLKLAKLIKLTLGLYRVFGVVPFFKKTGKNLDYTKYENTGDWNLRRIRADVFNTSLRVYFYCYNQLFNFNHENYLNQINIPTLIIHGRKDTMVPVENSIEWSKKIKQTKLIILEKANHIIVINNYPEVVSAIEQFIAKVI